MERKTEIQKERQKYREKDNNFKRKTEIQRLRQRYREKKSETQGVRQRDTGKKQRGGKRVRMKNLRNRVRQYTCQPVNILIFSKQVFSISERFIVNNFQNKLYTGVYRY